MYRDIYTLRGQNRYSLGAWEFYMSVPLGLMFLALSFQDRYQSEVLLVHVERSTMVGGGTHYCGVEYDLLVMVIETLVAVTAPRGRLDPRYCPTRAVQAPPNPSGIWKGAEFTGLQITSVFPDGYF